MRRPPQACLGHAASNTAVAGQPDGDLAEQRGDRVLTIILDPAGRATAAARRTARGVQPRLRRDELLLDASITAGFQMDCTFPSVTRSFIPRCFNLTDSRRTTNFAPDLPVARPKAFNIGNIET